MKVGIPADINTPDAVETSIGTLTFSDGLPDKDGAGVAFFWSLFLASQEK